MGGMIMPNKKMKNNTKPMYTTLTARPCGTRLFFNTVTSGLRALMRINAIKMVKSRSLIIHIRIRKRINRTVKTIVLFEISTFCIISIYQNNRGVNRRYGRQLKIFKNHADILLSGSCLGSVSASCLSAVSKISSEKSPVNIAKGIPFSLQIFST